MNGLLDRLAEPQNIRRLAIVFAILVVIAMSMGSVAVVQSQRASAATRDLAERNTEAIRVACTLLVNIIIESGAGGQRNTSKAAQAQAQLSALYIRVIGRSMTAAEQREARRLAAVVASSGGIVTTPDCNQVALHPENVRELIVRRAAVAATSTRVHPNP